MFTQIPSSASGSIRDGFNIGKAERWSRLDGWIDAASCDQSARDNLIQAAISLTIDRDERRKVKQRAKKVGNARMLWFLKLSERLKVERRQQNHPIDLKIYASRSSSVSDMLVDTARQIKELSLENMRLVEEGISIAEERDQTIAGKVHAESQLESLNSTVEWQKRNRQNGFLQPLNSDVGVTMIRMLAGESVSPTPTDCLRIISSIAGDRVEILPSAWKSAEEMQCFKNGDRLLRLLARLCGPFYESIQSGGDSQARMVFSTKEYAASEFAAVSNSPTHRARRTFRYNGRDIYMERHLRVGVENDRSMTIRVYFAWLSDEKKIVIGYCGKHLSVSSMSH